MSDRASGLFVDEASNLYQNKGKQRNKTTKRRCWIETSFFHSFIYFVVKSVRETIIISIKRFQYCSYNSGTNIVTCLSRWLAQAKPSLSKPSLSKPNRAVLNWAKGPWSLLFINFKCAFLLRKQFSLQFPIWINFKKRETNIYKSNFSIFFYF